MKSWGGSGSRAEGNKRPGGKPRRDRQCHRLRCMPQLQKRESGACTSIVNLLLEGRTVLQEYVVVPAQSVYKFEGLTFPEAALAEPLTVALEMLGICGSGFGAECGCSGPWPHRLDGSQSGTAYGGTVRVCLGPQRQTQQAQTCGKARGRCCAYGPSRPRAVLHGEGQSSLTGHS